MIRTTYQKIGKYHLENGLDNQDIVYEAESKTVKIIVIADGVSTCCNSRQGAEIACKAVSDIMLNETEYMFSSSKEKVAGLLSAYIYKQLLAVARINNDSVETYSSTLSFICYNKCNGEIMTFLLGDSLIYQMKNGIMTLACNPELFENSKTYTTTTKQVSDIIKIDVFKPKDASQYLLATDGAWKTFYLGGAFSNDFEEAVKTGNIIDYIEKQDCYDDCSIIMLDVPKGA